MCHRSEKRRRGPLHQRGALTTGRPTLGVIDYGMGNLHSAVKGLQKAGAEAYVVSAPSQAGGADGLVLPGVGHFGRCMQNLRSRGFDELVRDWIGAQRPFLGICLGLQLLYDSSEEGDEAGLGLVGGRVVRLPSGVRVPHMGWNTVEVAVAGGERGERGTSTMDKAIASGEYFYFVHSYAVREAPADCDVVLQTEYGVGFVSGFQKGPLWATQFHPEKSGAHGLAVLEAFVMSCEGAVSR